MVEWENETELEMIRVVYRLIFTKVINIFSNQIHFS